MSEGNKAAKHTQFWMLLALSSFIAAGGVVGDSTPAVIGAMIIAPLATPIYGVALATTIGDTKALRTSVLLLLGGIALNILIGVLVAALTLQRMPIDANPQIAGRTAPTLLDLGVAIAVGLAGSFAMARRDVSSIVAGVAIAISLVPVLAVVGITIGAGRFDLATGALILFLTNAAAIVVAGVLVFGGAHYFREAAEISPRLGRRARATIIIALIVLLIPLSGASVRTYLYQRYLGATRTAVDNWTNGTPWRVEGVNLINDDIVVTVVGPSATRDTTTLSNEIRDTVPDIVSVRLISIDGTETPL